MGISHGEPQLETTLRITKPQLSVRGLSPPLAQEESKSCETLRVMASPDHAQHHNTYYPPPYPVTLLHPGPLPISAVQPHVGVYRKHR